MIYTLCWPVQREGVSPWSLILAPTKVINQNHCHGLPSLDSWGYNRLAHLLHLTRWVVFPALQDWTCAGKDHSNCESDAITTRPPLLHQTSTRHNNIPLTSKGCGIILFTRQLGHIAQITVLECFIKLVFKLNDLDSFLLHGCLI